MRYLLIILMIIAFGCSSKETIHFYPLDKSQCVTVITKGETRWIIDGEYESVPDSNYVKLNIENIDPIGDGFHICWESEGYKWQAVVNESIIVESKLNKEIFDFQSSLPKDGYFEIPSEIKFRSDGCSVFSFSLMRLSPNQGSIVETD